MESLTIFAIAVGLAMDAFAVSIATGIKLGCMARVHHTIRLAFFFGFFKLKIEEIFKGNFCKNMRHKLILRDFYLKILYSKLMWNMKREVV